MLSENTEVKAEQSLASAYMLQLVEAHWLHIFGLETRDLEDGKLLEGGKVCYY